jgi:hypothetical protein
MKKALVWITAFIVSVAVHVGLFLVVPIWFTPEPIENQPRPQSELRIETQDVARSESSAVQPAGERTETENSAGSAIAQGAIPQSRAAAEPVTSAPVTEIGPPTAIAAVPDVASPVLTSSQALTAAISPTVARAESAVIAAPVPTAVTRASDITPEIAAIAADIPDDAVIPASASPSDLVTAATLPSAQTFVTDSAANVPATEAAPLTGARIDPALLPDEAAQETAPTGQALPQGELPAAEITADLAWSGGADSQIDPQALATIQSFMRPGDIGAQAGDVRDAMSDLLSQVPCARLQAEFDPETGSIVLRGHIPEEGLREPIRAALQAQVGTGLPVVDAMLILPRPQCGALAGIGNVGLPQSTEALTNPLLVGADAHARAYTYVEGDQLVLDMQAPDYDAYVYVDYFDASGNVIHLVPNETVPLILHPAKSAMRIGQSVDGEPALAITIGPPFGQEIAVAFAASAPLYDGLRPISEPAEPYLTWLRDQIAAARAENEDFKGEWVYFFISTRAQ